MGYNIGQTIKFWDEFGVETGYITGITRDYVKVRLIEYLGKPSPLDIQIWVPVSEVIRVVDTRED